jgi:hypothetical protein
MIIYYLFGREQYFLEAPKREGIISFQAQPFIQVVKVIFLFEEGTYGAHG